MLGLAVTAVVAGARAADPEYGQHDGNFALTLESPPPEPVVFWQRFDSSFDNNANGIFADALQPLNTIQWTLDLRGRDFDENFRARAASRARSAFTKTAQYGVRDAVVDLPFMVWLDDHQNWLADLLRDSIANVNEESVAPLNLSREGMEQSWWRKEASNGTHYGIRPLRTSPYAYVSHGISDGEKTILLAHARYYYDRFANHRVELALSTPIEYGVVLNVGSSYEFGSHDEQRLVVKFVKEFKGGGVAHVGFEVRERPALIAGISFAW